MVRQDATTLFSLPAGLIVSAAGLQLPRWETLNKKHYSPRDGCELLPVFKMTQNETARH